MTTKLRRLAMALSASMLTVIRPSLAQTWTQTSAPSTNWTAVASSADGTRLVAAVNSGGIYASVDSGGTWTLTSAPSNLWQCVVSSADGTRLVAAAGQSAYASVDGGVTWALTSIPIRCVASSSDGQRLIAANQNQLYTLTNGGGTWMPVTNGPSDDWTSVASSADGSKLVAGGNYLHLGRVWTSADFGATWTQSLCCRPYFPSIASSADGNTLIVCGEFGGVSISTNSGATWTPMEFGATAVACSADGTKLVAGDYLSTNSGRTWTPIGAPFGGLWSSVASSADGTKLVAAYSGGGIHISQSTPTPFLSLAPANNNLLLSWTVPSLPFVLQENSDLTTTNWTDVPTLPTLDLANLQNRVTLPLTNSNRFYRLRH